MRARHVAAVVLSSALASCSFGHTSHRARQEQSRRDTDLQMTSGSTTTAVSAEPVGPSATAVPTILASPSKAPGRTTATSRVATAGPRVSASTLVSTPAFGATVTSSTRPPAVTSPPTTVIDAGPAPAAGHGAMAMALGEGSVWVRTWTYQNRSATVTTLVRVDPATGHRVAVIPINTDTQGSVVVAGGFVWLDDTFKNQFIRVDARTNSVADTITIPAPFDTNGCRMSQGSAVVGAGSVWINSSCGAIARIDARTGKATMLDISGDVSDPKKVALKTFGTSAMWLSNSMDGIIELDPATNKVVSHIPLNSLNAMWAPQRILTATPGQLWVIASDAGPGATGNRVGVFRVDESARTATGLRSASKFDFGDLLTADGTVLWVSYNGRLRSTDAATGTVNAEYPDMPSCLPTMQLTAGAAWCGSYFDPLVIRLSLSDGAAPRVAVGAY